MGQVEDFKQVIGVMLETLQDEIKAGRRTREQSLVITKLEEALLWRQRDIEVNK